MAAQDVGLLDPMIRKLSRLADLNDDDVAALASLTFEVQDVGSSHHLVREGNKATRCCLLVKGYACRHKTTADGSRQILSFHIPGDILDLQHLLLSTADHNVQTITPARVAWLSMAELRQVARERPALGEAFWRDTLIDASIFREWVLNVGRRDAKSRVAHMLCEFAARHEAIGLDSPHNFELPMTQEQIADATGLTAVHVNRMLRALDEEGLTVRGKREIRITNWARLRQVADFDPTYLHMAA